jgi:hypothetical protein
MIEAPQHLRDVWATFPEPFTDGMEVTITWNQGDTVLFACESGPIRADALEPMFARLDQRRAVSGANHGRPRCTLGARHRLIWLYSMGREGVEPSRDGL